MWACSVVAIAMDFKANVSKFEPHLGEFCFYFLLKNGPKMGQPDKYYLEHTLQYLGILSQLKVLSAAYQKSKQTSYFEIALNVKQQKSGSFKI